MRERLDPELVGGFEAFAALMGGDSPNLTDLPTLRTRGREAIRAMKSRLPPVPDVVTEDLTVPGPAQAPDVAVRVYRPAATGNLPVLLWIHGGGYVVGSIEQDDFQAKLMALNNQCAVVSVEYRLAPEHPFPAPLDDCYAALQWVYRNARELHFDSSRIAIGGASAGGGLAASLALLARDRGEIPVKFQLLIYPMIDDRNVLPASAERPDTLMWSRGNNLTGWRAYLSREPGSVDLPAYAAAARASDLGRLPPAYIAVGALDLFLAEDIDYCARLSKAGVAVEMHVYPGAFHAFEVMGATATVSQRFLAERDAAIQRMFAR